MAVIDWFDRGGGGCAEPGKVRDTRLLIRRRGMHMKIHVLFHY